MPFQNLLDRLRPERLKKHLVEAIKCYSPPYAEEAVVRLFASILQKAGIPYELQPVPGPSREGGRANLLVRLGPEPLEWMWVGHLDTIAQPPDDHLGYREDGDILYGLGSADMKGACAAALEALLAFHEARLPIKHGIAFAWVVGEEEEGDGARLLAERYVAPLTVIGEPTDLIPCLEHYGYLEIRLRSGGIRAHAALPDIGASAIGGMLEWLTAVNRLLSKSLAPGSVFLNPREIQGGRELFVVADYCEAVLDFHLRPDATREAILEVLASAQAKAAVLHPECSFTQEERSWAPAYSIAPDDPRLRLLQKAWAALDLAWEPVAFRSHSDGNQLFAKGALPVICGPGRLEVAHTRFEHVPFSQVLLASRLYAAMLFEAATSGLSFAFPAKPPTKP